MGDKEKTPVFVIGSATYYPRLFESDIYKDLNMIYLDHRGFSNPRYENKYELDYIVEDIESIRRALDLDEMFLLGHSGHGFMAMAYAKKYPEHVLGLILSNLAPTNNKERQDLSIQYFEENAKQDRKDYFYEQISLLERDIEKEPEKRFSWMNIRMQAHSFYDYKFDGAYLWDDVYNNMDALDYLWGEAFAVYDTESFIKNTEKPVLLLLSEYDYLVSPPSLWDSIIKDTSVKMQLFSKSGHNPMLEEAKKYHKLIKQFIEKGSN